MFSLYAISWTPARTMAIYLFVSNKDFFNAVTFFLLSIFLDLLQGGAKVVGQCVKLMLILAQIFLAQNIPNLWFNDLYTNFLHCN